MNVSLEQAIEIHGRVLRYRKGAVAGAEVARQEAIRCKASGDMEGFEVWSRVGQAVAALNLYTDSKSQKH